MKRAFVTRTLLAARPRDDAIRELGSTTLTKRKTVLVVRVCSGWRRGKNSQRRPLMFTIEFPVHEWRAQPAPVSIWLEMRARFARSEFDFRQCACFISDDMYNLPTDMFRPNPTNHVCPRKSLWRSVGNMKSRDPARNQEMPD